MKMSRVGKPAWSVWLWVAACVVAPGCGGDGGGGGGGGGEGGVGIGWVTNQPNHFAIAGVGNAYTGVLTYVWSCDAAQANVALADGIGGGAFRLLIQDAAGTVVHDNSYTAAFAGAIGGVTAPGGAPGLWTVTFTLVGATVAGAVTIDADLDNLPDRIDVAGGYSTTCSLAYDVGWSAGPASVAIGAGLGSGSLRVRVWDGGDVLVYDVIFPAPIAVALNDLTASGSAGVWSVRIDFVATESGSALTLEHP